MSGVRPPGSGSMIAAYLCPSDPTLSISATQNGLTNYAGNAQAFHKGPRIGTSFGDGTSNTIAFAEHYAIDCDTTAFNWFLSFPRRLSVPNIPTIMHRASFADFDPKEGPYDRINDDVYPVTTGQPVQSMGSISGLSFQVSPKRQDCDPRLAQTAHHSGMTIALFDGSARNLSPGTSRTIYWALVTPNGGEVLDGDW